MTNASARQERKDSSDAVTTYLAGASAHQYNTGRSGRTTRKGPPADHDHDRLVARLHIRERVLLRLDFRMTCSRLLEDGARNGIDVRGLLSRRARADRVPETVS